MREFFWQIRGVRVNTKEPKRWDDSNGYKASNLTKYRHILVSLWTLYMVWNITALFYARLWYTETGQEEEVQ